MEIESIILNEVESEFKTSTFNHKTEILLNAVRNTVKSVMRFCGVHILRRKRICVVIAPIGAGKTTIVESVAANHLNNHVDTLSLEVIPDQNNRPILLIDMERTQDEILEGCDRVARRIRLENNPELSDGERFKDTYIHGFLQYTKTEDKLNALKELIDKYNPYLVLIDGGASFVYDVNDTKECVIIIGEFLSIADQKDLSLLITVHPNPGQQNDFKPRGVFGSELLRYAESVLLLKRAPDDRDTRILTTSFMHGKNRSGSDNLESYFRWSDENKMFLSCEYSQPTGSIKKKDEQAEVFTAILQDGKQITHGELLSALVNAGKSESTAKRWIRESTLITKNTINGRYSLR